jgi:hypothetical protein
MPECSSCGARTGEAAFPHKRKRGARSFCTDCETEEARQATPSMPRPPITRARYRAALRFREASPQGDLVDLIVASP